MLLGRAWIAENVGLGIGRDVDVLGVGADHRRARARRLRDRHGELARLGLGAHARLRRRRAGPGRRASWRSRSRLANPIMPLRIFRIRGLASSSVIRGLLITGMYAMFFIGALYLEHVRGLRRPHHRPGLPAPDPDPGRAVAGAGRLAGETASGPRPTLIVGLAAVPERGSPCSAASAPAPPTSPTSRVPFALMGIGAGLSFMPLLTIAMAEVPRADAGHGLGHHQHLAAGLHRDRRGGAGHALQRPHAHPARPRRRANTAALLGGYRLAFGVGAGCVGAALLAALAWIVRPTRRRTPTPCPAASSPSSSYAPSR